MISLNFILLLLITVFILNISKFQASFTKDYLASIRQGDVNLPDGPLLLNPTSLMNALHREVIEKKPEKFKIACLNDIKTLFPDGNNPLFAGYGNRANVRIVFISQVIVSITFVKGQWQWDRVLGAFRQLYTNETFVKIVQ